jgi:protein-S-isoprenylcysteine O-methyltransferase Ste14
MEPRDDRDDRSLATPEGPDRPERTDRIARRKRLAKRVGVGLAAFTVQIGPPLLIWRGWREFASHPARKGLAGVAAAGAVAAGMNGLTFSRGERHVSRQQVAPVLAFSAVLLGRLLSPVGDRYRVMPLRHDGVRYAGIAACAAGLAMFEWPRVLMREQFSFNAAIQPGHRLVTKGPYRLVRHPGYAGLILMNLGYALAFRSKLGLLPVPVVAATLAWRIRDEEKLLLAHFGTEYEEFQQRTARLVPGIY